MVRFSVIKVVLLDNTVLQYNNKTLLEVAKECLSYPLVNHNPILLKVGEDYNLYFNTSLFKDWVNKQIDLEELLDQVKVTNLLRNKETIHLKDATIDEESLWLQKDNLCILADSDEFVSVQLDDRFKPF